MALDLQKAIPSDKQLVLGCFGGQRVYLVQLLGDTSSLLLLEDSDSVSMFLPLPFPLCLLGTIVFCHHLLFLTVPSGVAAPSFERIARETTASHQHP